MRKLFVLVACLFVQFALAEPPPGPPRIKAGTEVRIVKYVEANDSFEVAMTQEEEQGPFFATAKELKKAIVREGSLSDFIRNMRKDSATVYVLKNKLLLLPEVKLPPEKYD